MEWMLIQDTWTDNIISDLLKFQYILVLLADLVWVFSIFWKDGIHFMCTEIITQKPRALRVLSSFSDFTIQVATKIIFVRVWLYTHTQGAKICKSLAPPCSKYHQTEIVLMNKNFILFRSGIFLTSGSWKTARFQFEVGNGSRKYDVAPVLSIYPQSYIKISQGVSEWWVPQT